MQFKFILPAKSPLLQTHYQVPVHLQENDLPLIKEILTFISFEWFISMKCTIKTLYWLEFFEFAEAVSFKSAFV